jgi:four helix bundle protein
MKTENVIQQKSYAFAIRIYYLCKLLQEAREFDLARQLFRSGTSIGANVEEAIGAQSGKDFIMKMSIAYKECRETHYWLRLTRDTSILPNGTVDQHIEQTIELLRILSSILRSMKEKQ